MGAALARSCRPVLNGMPAECRSGLSIAHASDAPAQRGLTEGHPSDWVNQFRALVEAPDALQRRDEIFALIKGVESTLPVLPEGPIEEALVHPPNCCCGRCRSSMPPGDSQAAPSLLRAETEQIIIASRRMNADTEAQWREFMSQMRRPPRGLLVGRKAARGEGGERMAVSSSPALPVSLNADCGEEAANAVEEEEDE